MNENENITTPLIKLVEDSDSEHESGREDNIDQETDDLDMKIVIKQIPKPKKKLSPAQLRQRSEAGKSNYRKRAMIMEENKVLKHQVGELQETLKRYNDQLLDTLHSIPTQYKHIATVETHTKPILAPQTEKVETPLERRRRLRTFS